MQSAQADPNPCDRCRHRKDMHEDFRGLRICRACNYIALRYPCSPTTLQDEAVLKSLSFDRK